MLSSFTSARKPFDTKVIICPLLEQFVQADLWIDDSNRNGGRVDPATFFCGAYALHASAAGLGGQPRQIVAFYLIADFMMADFGRTFSNDPVLSTLAVEKPFIGTGEVPDQKFGICAAFSSVDFYRSNHNKSPPTLIYRGLPRTCQYTNP